MRPRQERFSSGLAHFGRAQGALGVDRCAILVKFGASTAFAPLKWPSYPFLDDTDRLALEQSGEHYYLFDSLWSCETKNYCSKGYKRPPGSFAGERRTVLWPGELR